MATACDSDTDIAVDVLQMSCIAVPIGEAGAAAKISRAADTTSVVSTSDATVLCIEGTELHNILLPVHIYCSYN